MLVINVPVRNGISVGDTRMHRVGIDRGLAVEGRTHPRNDITRRVVILCAEPRIKFSTDVAGAPVG